MLDKNMLKVLSKAYPDIKSATEEIVNLSAILSLPKGTEYFLSDLHGENEAFIHMIKSASGVIKSKIDEIFGDDLTETQRDELAALVYNAEAEIERNKANTAIDYDAWCKENIYRLVLVCKAVSSKYTQSKVRKRLPKNYAYIIDELLHSSDEYNMGNYYNQIISSMVECEVAEEFMIEMADLISALAVDRLHIIGDIWDRGAHPEKIMDYLMNHHDVDIQWGNHDIIWIGASTGNWACIANVLRMNIGYNNFDMLEFGYGINLRPLATMAEQVYKDDPCTYFMPKVIEENKYDPVELQLAAKMNKAISICQFKVEGKVIKKHPEYKLDHRRLLDKIDFEKGTVKLRDGEFPLRDTNFPTIDPEHPYDLTPEERMVMDALSASFLQSEKLQSHIKFMVTHGAMYTISNGNLLFHGCLPMDEDGNLAECTIQGYTAKGKAYMDYLDDQVRKSYFRHESSEETGRRGDLMWYMWLSPNSPLFGKDQMTTFERFFVEDKRTHKEYTVPYYRHINNKETCLKILREFGLDEENSIILNGHVPVKIKNGESPIKGEGKLFVIDGGMSKAYQKETGIAGYTFIFNSMIMALVEHKPFKPQGNDGKLEYRSPKMTTVKTLNKRMLIQDTDIGSVLYNERENLKELVKAYKNGDIKENSRLALERQLGKTN